MITKFYTDLIHGKFIIELKNFFQCKFRNIFDPFLSSYIDNKNSLESKIYASRPDDLKVILNLVDAVFTPFLRLA